MRVDTATISAADTALALRVRLGPIRAWSDFLADNIRGRQTIRGLTLKPCGKRSDGKSYRPVYAVEDIEKFIAEVLAREPAAGRTPIKQIVLPVDRGRPWRIEKFDEHGLPVAMLRPNVAH